MRQHEESEWEKGVGGGQASGAQGLTVGAGVLGSGAVLVLVLPAQQLAHEGRGLALLLAALLVKLRGLRANTNDGLVCTVALHSL